MMNTSFSNSSCLILLILRMTRRKEEGEVNEGMKTPKEEEKEECFWEHFRTPQEGIKTNIKPLDDDGNMTEEAKEIVKEKKLNQVGKLLGQGTVP